MIKQKVKDNEKFTFNQNGEISIQTNKTTSTRYYSTSTTLNSFSNKPFSSLFQPEKRQMSMIFEQFEKINSNINENNRSLNKKIVELSRILDTKVEQKIENNNKNLVPFIVDTFLSLKNNDFVYYDKIANEITILSQKRTLLVTNKLVKQNDLLEDFNKIKDDQSSMELPDDSSASSHDV